MLDGVGSGSEGGESECFKTFRAVGNEDGDDVSNSHVCGYRLLLKQPFHDEAITTSPRHLP